MAPTDQCDPPDAECLWRVAGVSKLTKMYKKAIGLVRAPNRQVALRVAIDKYSPLYTDIEIPGEPLPAI